MKRLIFLFPFLLLSWSAFSQAVTQTNFVGKFTFQSFSAGGTSDVSGTLDAFNDQTNQYFANNIEVGDVIWDNQGNRWEVMAVNSSNLLQADVDLRDINNAGGTPIGVGLVSRETPNLGLSLFVPDNNIGISQQLKSRIETHNMILIDQYLANYSGDCSQGVYQEDHGFLEGDILGQVAGNGPYFESSTSGPDSIPVAFVCSVISTDSFLVSSEGWVQGAHPYSPGTDYFVQDTPGTFNTTPDANYNVFGFRAYPNARYYDIPEQIGGLGSGGSSPDGNGIYSGSGNVPGNTEATLADGGTFTIKDAGGNDRIRVSEETNIAITATTGFTATTTSGIMGLTHTGSGGQLIIQSQDERATFQGEDTRINGDTIIHVNAASGSDEMIIRDNSIQLSDLPDDNSPVKFLGVTADRFIVESDVPAGGAADDWGSQVVVSDATLNGDGTVGSPLSVAAGADLNGIISALPSGNVNILNPSDNDLTIEQNNGNKFQWNFGGGNGPTIGIGDLDGGGNAANSIDASQMYLTESGNTSAYGNNFINFESTVGVINPQSGEYSGGSITLRQANGDATGNKFPQIRLKQYGDGYPRLLFSSGSDANLDKDLFDTNPIGAGKILGAVEFHGQNSAGDATNDAKNVWAAGVNGVSREAFSATNSGARLEFYTTVVGTTGAISTMILEDDGRLRLPQMPAKAVSAPASDYQMDGNGYLIRTSPTQSGVFSGSTDGSGQVTITHNTGTDPDYANMIIQSTTTAYFVTLVSTSSTNAIFKVWDTSGAAVVSTGITASWIVK